MLKKIIEFLSQDPTPPYKVLKTNPAIFYIPHRGVYVIPSKIVRELKEMCKC